VTNLLWKDLILLIIKMLSPTIIFVIVVSCLVVVGLALGLGLYFGLRSSSTSVTPTGPLPPFVTPTGNNGITSPTPTPLPIVVTYADFLAVPQCGASANTSLNFISTQTNVIVGGSFDLGTGTASGGSFVIVSPDQTRLYVTNPTYSNSISVVDITTLTAPSVITTIASPIAVPMNGAITPDGRYLYVACATGGVVQFFTPTMASVKILSASFTNSTSCILNPAGTILYVFCTSKNLTTQVNSLQVVRVNVTNPLLPFVLTPVITLDTGSVAAPGSVFEFKGNNGQISDDGAFIYAVPYTSDSAGGGPKIYTIDILNNNTVTASSVLYSDTGAFGTSSICLSVDNTELFAVQTPYIRRFSISLGTVLSTNLISAQPVSAQVTSDNAILYVNTNIPSPPGQMLFRVATSPGTNAPATVTQDYLVPYGIVANTNNLRMFLQ